MADLDLSGFKTLTLEGGSGNVNIHLLPDDMEKATAVGNPKRLYRLLENGGDISPNFSGPSIIEYGKNWTKVVAGAEQEDRIFSNNENEVFPDDMDSCCIEEQEKHQDGGSKKTENNHWSHKETMVLLEQYKDNKEQFNSQLIKKSEIWKTISQKLKKKSAITCEKKFSNMRIRYRSLKDIKMSTGSGRPITWIYYDAMDSIFKDDPSTVPLAIVSSNPTANMKRKASADIDEQEVPSVIKEPAKRSKKEAPCAPAWFNEFIREQREENKIRREEFKKFREDFLQTQNEKNNILKSLVEIFKK